MGDRRFTYAQLSGLVNRVASGLRALGLQPGDHVALSCPNLPYFPIVYFGILRAGCVVVPLNVLLKPREIAYHLQDSDAKAYFCFEGTPELPMAAWGREAFDQVALPALRGDDHRPGVPRSAGRCADAGGLHGVRVRPVRPGAAASRRHRRDPLYVRHDRSAEGRRADTREPGDERVGRRGPLPAVLRTRPDAHNVTLITLPLFHSFGQVWQMCVAVQRHAMVLLPQFDPAAVLDNGQRERVTSGRGCRRCSGGCRARGGAAGGRVRGRRAPAMLHVGRRRHAGRADEAVRGALRRAHPRGLRALGDLPGGDLQPRRSTSKPGTVGTPILGVEVAVVDDHDRPCPPVRSARSSSAATTS